MGTAADALVMTTRNGMVHAYRKSDGERRTWYFVRQDVAGFAALSAENTGDSMDDQ